MDHKDIDHSKAMNMLNSTLREMKGELGEVDNMPLEGPKKKMAHHMHQIYDELNGLITKYDGSNDHDDLNYAFKQIELLKPAFVLNYNEILR